MITKHLTEQPTPPSKRRNAEVPAALESGDPARPEEGQGVALLHCGRDARGAVRGGRHDAAVVVVADAAGEQGGRRRRPGNSDGCVDSGVDPGASGHAPGGVVASVGARRALGATGRRQAHWRHRRGAGDRDGGRWRRLGRLRQEGRAGNGAAATVGAGAAVGAGARGRAGEAAAADNADHAAHDRAAGRRAHSAGPRAAATDGGRGRARAAQEARRDASDDARRRRQACRRRSRSVGVRDGIVSGRQAVDGPQGAFAEGEALFRGGDVEGALAKYLDAARANPSDAKVQRQIGKCYNRLGQRDRAMPYLKKYLELAPDASDAAFIRSIIELK